MGSNYQPEFWRDLYVMLSTASAALVGLLFVATSLHLDEIVHNPGFRVRARANIVYLLTTLVEAALILTPQRPEILGAELIAVNLLGIQLPISAMYHFYCNTEMAKRGGYSIYRSLAFFASFVLGIAGGAGLIAGANWGMYLVTAAYISFVVFVALNAWRIMLGVGQEKRKRSRR